MKNQYVGDIGDYTKLGILRKIQNTGLTLGVNWYLTPNDAGVDGRHIEYLSRPCDTADTELHSILKTIVADDLRSVAELENRQLLCNAAYFHKVLDFSGSADKKALRDSWHKEAVALLRSQNLIFLDPDNGLEVSSHKPHCINGNKFAAYQEVADYFREGASVIVYNHRDRSPESKYLERFTRFREMADAADADLFCLKASRFSVRDYLFLSQARHTQKLRTAVDEMLKTGWNQYLSYRTL